MRRRLDAELVRRGLARSRGQAVEVITAGRVLVGGSPAPAPARLVDADESIKVTGGPPRFVSRGGEKLDRALEAFGVDVAGRRVLDAGASTGGFTDCVLQRGAAAVVAVDVGRGQLAWSLRTDARVTVMERSNVRALDADAIGGAADVVVADLSFISLVTVAPALASCSAPDATMVLLVKPQFEAGRARLGRGGIVRDPEVHRAVLREVRDGLAQRGLFVHAAVPSPLRGADGNIEFLVHVDKRAPTAPDGVLDAAVDAVASEGGSA